MTSRRRILGLGSLALLSATAALTAEPVGLSQVRSRIERAYGFDVRFDLPRASGLDGKVLAPEERLEAMRRIETWSAAYPSGFLRRYIDEIVVLNNLVVDGIHALGHRDVRRVFLQFRGKNRGRMQRREFDHEVFHALEGGLAETDLPERWEGERARALRLRAMWDDYRVTPSHRYTFSWDRVLGRPWVAYVPVVNLVWMLVDSDDPPQGFANVIGTVAPREDRATVAAALLSGDEAFLRRAAADRELREKVAIVRAMYLAGSAGGIDDSYWSDLTEGPIEVPALAELEERLWNGGSRPEPTGQEFAATPANAPLELATRSDLPRGGPPVVAVVAPTPVPTPVPKPVPKPAAKPTPKPAAPPPAVGADAAPPSPSEMYARGVAAFDEGAAERAESLWAHMLRSVDPNYGTIRIAINCDFGNVQKVRAVLGEAATFYALSYEYRGRPCHLAMSGLYRTRDEASAAIAGLPASVQAQNPRPTSVREVLKLVR